MMPVVAGNGSSKWDACRAKATRLEYCLRDNNYRPIDCAPEILDLKECCRLHQVCPHGLLPMPLQHRTSFARSVNQHAACAADVLVRLYRDCFKSCNGIHTRSPLHCGNAPLTHKALRYRD